MAKIHELLVEQIMGLSWIRCCMEEGVNFTNKQTGVVETSEKIVFDSFEAKNGLFDLPKANVSPKGLEKNILEVIGSYIVFGGAVEINKLLLSTEVTSLLRAKLETVRGKDNHLD